MVTLKHIFHTAFCFLSLCILSESVLAQQSSYFFKQRAIMMAQLEYEKNLDLMLLDPENCKLPLKKDDRIRVLKANIKLLNENGKFSHCRDKRFFGRRKIIEALRKQRASVQQIKSFDDSNGLIVNNNGNTNDAPVPDIETIIEPVDDSLLPESGTSLSNFGTPPSEPVIMPGYAGVPYMANPMSDETFHFILNKIGTQYHYQSKNLPPGLTFAHSEGLLSGVPKTPGDFTPQVAVGYWGTYGATQMKFRGPIRMKILPTPKHTVLDSTKREQETIISFTNAGQPLLSVQFLKAMRDGRSLYSDPVRTINGVKKGKIYFEAKIHDLGEKGSIGWVKRSDREHSGYALDNTYIHMMANKTHKSKFEKGDVFMAALDIEKKQVWYGMNGAWFTYGYRLPPGEENVPTASANEIKNGVFDNMTQNTEFVPSIIGSKGTHVTFNFGDQPWEFEPPKGFSGLPFSPPAETIANMWDSNSATDYIHTYNLTGNGGWSSLQFYTAGAGGDVMLGMGPKSSGRWQFEISSRGYAERTRMGIAPASVNVKKLQEVGLGASGTRSIGLRRLDEADSRTGKGVIEVDGKDHPIDQYDDEAIFTFDCDFDKNEVKIFANGSLILTTELPENQSRKWVIAASSASGSVHWRTHPDTLKYPVKGAKPWVFDTELCLNCATQMPVSMPEEEKGIVCPEQETTYGLEMYIPEKHGPNYPRCTLPETPVGQFAVCYTPGRKYACKDSSVGPKTHCTNDGVSYKSAEICELECQDSGRRVKMDCIKRGDWTPSLR